MALKLAFTGKRIDDRAVRIGRMLRTFAAMAMEPSRNAMPMLPPARRRAFR